MKEKPISFSTELIPAILQDRKTVTRRVLKFQGSKVAMPNCYDATGFDVVDLETRATVRKPWDVDTINHYFKCRFQPGDILYVKETYAPNPYFGSMNQPEYFYRADGEFESDGKWKSPCFMPRKAARIFLRVTDVRVERLMAISAMDVVKEGMEAYCDPDRPSAIDQFAKLWDKLIPDYPWESNPFVWRIAFERIENYETR